MMTLNDGRSELWQWDTGRKLTVDADCSQVHFSNKVFGRSIDVDVIDGSAIIPDILLQTDKDLNVWAFVGTAENGYTKISKTFKVNRRNKPADYVFTQPDQTSLEEIKEKIEYLESIQDPDAIKNAVEDYLEQNPVEVPVQSVNGQTGEVKLTAGDVGAISQDDLQDATNKALAQAKASGEFDGAQGPKGDPGETGPAGPTGETGPEGPQGERGPQGEKGDKGDKGDPGEPGQKGDKGDPGEKGEQGIQGIQGEKGEKGDKGDKGDTGATGAQGEPGKDGADGKDGYTPVKGVDYFDGAPGKDYVLTQADKTEIAEMAADLVEVPEGGMGGADWNAAEGEPGHVLNRTHYEAQEVVNEPLNITWDGNTEGLVNGGKVFFKISDLVLTDDQIRKVYITGSTSTSPTSIESQWENLVSNGFVTEDYVAVAYSNIGLMVFIRKDNTVINTFGDATFPEKGIYSVYLNSGAIFVTSVTTTEPIEQTKTVVHKLDKKFLPDDVGGGGLKFDYIIRDDADSESGYEFIGMTRDEFYAASLERPLVGYVGGNSRWYTVLHSKSTGIYFEFYYQPQPITYNKLKKITWKDDGTFEISDVEPMSVT